MSKQIEYRDFEEKSRNFKENKKIYSKEDLLEIIENKFANQYRYFRGVPEAKYKLYSLGQRYWIENELKCLFTRGYIDFFETLIKHVRGWNNGTIDKFLELQNNKLLNEIALLSFMQHYGVPTPFVDFTTNAYIALFFAAHYSKITASDNEFDNYFSLYCVPEQYFCGLEEIKILEKVYAYIKNIESEDINDYIKNNRATIRNLASEERLIKIEYIGEKYRLKDVLNDYIINSTRIKNQEGLFVFNPSDEKSIEEFDTCYNDKFTCYNIHKNLREYILDYLKNEKKITYDYLLPNFDLIGNYALNEILKLKK